jgi:hypothetical protein
VASETEQELRRYLEGVHFAANKEDLVPIAMSNDATKSSSDSSRTFRGQNFRTSEKSPTL